MCECPRCTTFHSEIICPSCGYGDHVEEGEDDDYGDTGPYEMPEAWRDN